MNKSTERLKKNKTVKSVFIALSLIFITVICTACTRGDGHNEVGRINDVRKEKLDRGGIYAQVNDSGKALSEGQKELLESYAYKYAQTLCTLEPRDISGFFTGYTEDYYKNLTAYKTLTSIRKMSKNDMVLEYAQVTYNIQQVTERKSEVEVLLTEDNVQKFAHLSQPSYSYNLNHIFVLRQKDGQWFVKSHEQEEDFFLLSIEAWNDAAGGSYADKSENAVNILIADAQENIDKLKISTGNQPEDIEVANTAYDRDAAVNYAQQWCNKRNHNGLWLAYDMYGGNCQNFASQCIYAGGIEMDCKGYPECQWKFYSETQNDSQTKSGRSYSWTGVDPFYTYAVLNRSSGLVCQADLALEYAEKGDIVQVGAYHDWRHSLVVIDIVYNSDGSQKDIVVASNTADRWNYPLSAYIYTYPRLIHILGQN